MRTCNSKQLKSRRKFLWQAALGSGMALGGGTGVASTAGKIETLQQTVALRTERSSSAKTVLSFYVDDTNPYIAGVEASLHFLDFVTAEGIAGESSVILGFEWEDHGLLSRPTTDEQRAYIKQLHRAYECGIDSHMELMTHSGLLDFRTGRPPADAEHEGIWLYEPRISVEEYQTYFGHIVEEGEKIGICFTGVTWPGCACAVCERRFGELFKSGPHTENPNLWKALLNLAKQRKFRGPTVPCFILGGSEEHTLRLMAGDGPFGVYDLYPNAGDYFGIWENNPARVNADYYIAADGESGRLVEKIRAGALRCVFYTHWQGVNPGNGVGWEAFKLVVHRIQKRYSDRVIWMRPSAVTDQYHSQTAKQLA